MKQHILPGLAIVAVALLPFSRFAAAAPDNTRGMAILFAALAGDGTTLAGSGVVSVSHPAQGQSWVTFDRDVSNCGYYATVANYSGVLSSGHAATALVSGAPQVVAVQTRNSAGSAADIGVHLLVFCNK